jgi:hypothetical protein
VSALLWSAHENGWRASRLDAYFQARFNPKSGRISSRRITRRKGKEAVSINEFDAFLAKKTSQIGQKG